MEELLMSAEYIVSGGNQNVILCERGIRTLKPPPATLRTSPRHPPAQTENPPAGHCPDQATPPALRPSAHPCQDRCGRRGGRLNGEVHPNPPEALCDGAQSITPDTFDSVMKDIRALCTL